MPPANDVAANLPSRPSDVGVAFVAASELQPSVGLMR